LRHALEYVSRITFAISWRRRLTTLANSGSFVAQLHRLVRRFLVEGLLHAANGDPQTAYVHLLARLHGVRVREVNAWIVTVNRDSCCVSRDCWPIFDGAAPCEALRVPEGRKAKSHRPLFLFAVSKVKTNSNGRISCIRQQPTYRTFGLASLGIIMKIQFINRPNCEPIRRGHAF
jgi:hypothetical protein